MSQFNLTSQPSPSVPTYGPQWLVDLSWLFWVFAIVLALTGLYFLWRFLLRDPDRHKRRCPKCWYEMTGVTGLRCPECGREHASERKLFKSRHKRHQALAALLFFLFAFSTAITPRIAQRGWVRSIPTPALIAVSYIYDTEKHLLYREAGMRISQDYWHRKGKSAPSISSIASVSTLDKMCFLIRARSELKTIPASQPLLRPSALSPAWLGVDVHSFTISVLRDMHDDGIDVSTAIVPAIQHPDPATQLLVLDAVTTFFSSPPQPITEALRACLQSNDRDVFKLAADRLSLSLRDSADLPAIIDGARRHPGSLSPKVLLRYDLAGIDACANLLHDPDVAAEAAKVLLTAPRSEQNRGKVLQAAKTARDPTVRADCVTIFAMWSKPDPGVRFALADILVADPSETVRLYALSNLASLCNSKIALYLPASQVLPVLISDLSAESPGMRYLCALNLASFGPDAAPALPALQAIVDNPNEPNSLRKAAADAIAAINSTQTRSPAATTSPPHNSDVATPPRSKP